MAEGSAYKELEKAIPRGLGEGADITMGTNQALVEGGSAYKGLGEGLGMGANAFMQTNEALMSNVPSIATPGITPSVPASAVPFIKPDMVESTRTGVPVSPTPITSPAAGIMQQIKDTRVPATNPTMSERGIAGTITDSKGNVIEVPKAKATPNDLNAGIEDLINKLSKQTYNDRGEAHSMDKNYAQIVELKKAQLGLEGHKITAAHRDTFEAERLQELKRGHDIQHQQFLLNLAEKHGNEATKRATDWIGRNAEKDVAVDEMGNKVSSVNHAKTFFKAYNDNLTVPKALEEDVQNAGKRFEAAKPEWYNNPTIVAMMKKNKITDKNDPRVLRLMKEHYLQSLK
jgi:hypothetical protein